MSASFGVEDVSVEGALDGVSVTVPAHEITAVVGGDGAGKTTLLRVLTGGRAPDRGRVRGARAERIGYVPTGSGFYPDLTVAENLRFAAAAYHVRDRFPERAAELLDRTGLAPFPDRLAGRLSGGQRQKLAVAMAMLHRPDLLALDEPTTGLDPSSRADVWRLAAGAAAGGAAVVVTTSYLDEAERATTVVVLSRGRVLLAGAPGDVVAALPGHLVELAQPVDASRAWHVGARWRQWVPPGAPRPAGEPVEPRLEDAVVVAMLDSDGPGPT